MVFVGYMGADNFDLRLAPMYQDAKKVERMLQEEAAGGSAPAANANDSGGDNNRGK